MIRSMTAYANGTQHCGNASIECEIRSVNHRYLDVQFRLPEGLRRLEPQLRDLARKQLKRGKVECSLRLRHEVEDGGLLLDMERVEKLIQASRQIAALTESETIVNPLEILRWPGVQQEAEPDVDGLEEDVLGLFQSTLDDLQLGREREGQALAAAASERSQGLQALALRVRSALPDIRAQFEERLRERLQVLPEEVAEARLEAEIVLLAQRMDVAEELDRLDAHLEEIDNILRGREAGVGKRLDFLAQELNREANTLGSKSVTVFTSTEAVEAKVLIEQLREQIQNIE